MNYNEVARQLKAKHPEYANRDNKELVEKYVQRFPEKASLIDFNDYEIPEDKSAVENIVQGVQDLSQKVQNAKKEDVGNYAKGVAQSLSQGVMWGQAPHVSGVLNEALNLPKKIYGIKNKEDALQFYRNLGKDYVKGREKLKEEQGNFAEENPKTALASEMLGSLGAGGLSLIRGGGQGLLRQVLKGGLEGTATGSLAGGLYGLSNTKGEGVDLKGGLLGAGLGSLLGGTLGAGLPVGTKIANKTGDLIGYLGRLWGKGVDKVADSVTPVKLVKNPLRESSPIKQEGDILAKPKNMEDSFVNSRVQDYLPEQNLVVKYMKKDDYVLDELASGKDVGRRFDEYGEQAVNQLKDVKNVVKNAENEAYAKEGITDDYMLDGNKFVEDIENAIEKFKNDSRTYKQNEGEADKFLNNVLEEWTKNNGQISFGKLKTFTKDVNKKRVSTGRDTAKGTSSSEYDLWSEISQIISKTKRNDAKLKKPTEMYAELSDAIEKLEADTELNFDKPKNFAKNIFTSARDRADGGTYEKALEDFVSVIDKYDGTKILGDLPSKIRMAKVSYVLRNSVKDSKLSRDVKSAMTPSSLAKRKLAEYLTGKNISSEDYYRILAQRMKKGEITPKDLEGNFRRISIKGLSDDEANEMYVRYLLLGKRAGAIPSVLSSFVKGGGLR